MLFSGKMISPSSYKHYYVKEEPIYGSDRLGEYKINKTENIDLQAGFVKVNGKGSRERVIYICQQETISVNEG